MPLRMTITADDAGMSAGIDAAIHEMARANTVTTASLMMTMPAYSGQFSPFEIPTGVHLDITEGTPLSPALANTPLVNSAGHFAGRQNSLQAGFLLSSHLRTAIKRELAAQIDQFQQHYGSATHITTHHHFHAFPALKGIVYELAADYGIQWIRNNALRRAVLPANILLPKASMRHTAHTMPDYVVLVQAWQSSPPQRLVDRLSTLEGWVEIVMHPSTTPDPTFPTGVLMGPDARAQERIYTEALVAILRQCVWADI